MKFEFIQVNNSILDYSEYARSVLLLKNYLKHRLFDVFLEEGFKAESEMAASYSGMELVFYSKAFDLEVKILLKKREEEKFT